MSEGDWRQDVILAMTRNTVVVVVEARNPVGVAAQGENRGTPCPNCGAEFVLPKRPRKSRRCRNCEERFAVIKCRGAQYVVMTLEATSDLIDEARAQRAWHAVGKFASARALLLAERGEDWFASARQAVEAAIYELEEFDEFGPRPDAQLLVGGCTCENCQKPPRSVAFAEALPAGLLPHPECLKPPCDCWFYQGLGRATLTVNLVVESGVSKESKDMHIYEYASGNDMHDDYAPGWEELSVDELGEVISRLREFVEATWAERGVTVHWVAPNERRGYEASGASGTTDDGAPTKPLAEEEIMADSALCDFFLDTWTDAWHSPAVVDALAAGGSRNG